MSIYYYTQLAQDSFQRASENPLSGGGKWVTNAAFSNLKIVSDLVEATNAGGDNLETYNGAVTWPADQYSSVVMNSVANGAFAGAATRFAAATAVGYYGVVQPGGGITLYSWNGSSTSLGTAVYAFNPTDVLTTLTHGTTIIVQISGTAKITVTDSTTATGFPGIEAYDISAVTDVKLGAWTGGSVSTTPPPVIDPQPMLMQIPGDPDNGYSVIDNCIATATSNGFDNQPYGAISQDVNYVASQSPSNGSVPDYYAPATSIKVGVAGTIKYKNPA